MNPDTDLLFPRLQALEIAVQEVSKALGEGLLSPKGPTHFSLRNAIDFEQSQQSWKKIEADFQKIRPQFASWEKHLAQEARERLEELNNPSSAENLAANLRWLIARGTKDNLALLTKRKKDPRYPTTENLQLIDMAIQKLSGQASEEDSPRVAVQKGEEAYSQHKEEWDQKYAGRYIAVYQGEVIAAYTDKKKLLGAIMRKQQEKGPFYACILKVPKTEPLKSSAISLS